MNLSTTSGSTQGSERPSARNLHRIVGILRDESVLLRRVLYKGQNEHRREGWWQRVKEVGRDLGFVLEGARECEGEDGVSSEKGRSGGSNVDEVTLIIRSLKRNLRLTLFLKKGQESTLKSYGFLAQQIALANFMPVAIVLSAIMSRLHATFVGLSDELVKRRVQLCDNLKNIKTDQVAPTVTSFYRSLPKEMREELSSDDKCGPLMRSLSKGGSSRKAPKITEEIPVGVVVADGSTTEIPISPRSSDRASRHLSKDIGLRRTAGPRDEGEAELGVTRKRKADRTEAHPEVATPIHEGESKEDNDVEDEPDAVRPEPKRRKQKKRRKGDEIDEIFGML